MDKKSFITNGLVSIFQNQIVQGNGDTIGEQPWPKEQAQYFSGQDRRNMEIIYNYFHFFPH